MVIYGTQKKMIGRIKSKFREAQEDFHLYELIKGASLAFGFRVLSAGLAFGLSVFWLGSWVLRRWGTSGGSKLSC